ncbi:MAG: hypothetical protein ACE5H4_01215 [Candidatus Thorarchaeota archaeon]
MKQQSSVTRSKGIRLVLIGITIAIFGVLLDAYLMERYWANRPPYSTGPILLGTAGLLFLFPLGVIIAVSGLVLLALDRLRDC